MLQLCVCIMSLYSFGIIAGLLCAFLQALNYVLTKSCQIHGLTGLKMLLATHIAMGVMVFFPLIFTGWWREFRPEFLLWMVLINIPYLTAQYCVIQALRLSDASIVSPLLILKIPVISTAALLFWDASFSLRQYACMALIVAGAWCFSLLSGRIKLGPLLIILLGSACYCGSDTAFVYFVREIEGYSAVEASAIGTCFNYLFCGLIALPFWSKCQVTVKAVWMTKWVALAWLLGVLCVLITFSINGLVPGNILQSLRGVIGVLISFFFYRSLSNDSRLVWQVKLVVAAMMSGCVALFYL